MIETRPVRRTVIDRVHEWGREKDLLVLSCRHQRLVPWGSVAVGSAVECPACPKLRTDVNTR